MACYKKIKCFFFKFFQFRKQGYQGAPGKPGVDGLKGQPVSALYYLLLVSRYRNTANQNTGKQLFIVRCYTQPSHRALRTYSFLNLENGPISSFFQLLFGPV